MSRLIINLYPSISFEALKYPQEGTILDKIAPQDTLDVMCVCYIISGIRQDRLI